MSRMFSVPFMQVIILHLNIEIRAAVEILENGV